MLQDPPDLCAPNDERDQAHLATAHRAQQRENLVDSRDQHRPHSIDHADVEVDMLIQAGAEAVDEGHGADVQGGLVQLRRTGCEPAGFAQ